MLRLPTFRHVRPTTVDEALEALAEGGERARILAGGTDLLVNLKHEVIEADVLVSLAAVEELRGIRATDDGGLTLGPMTPLAQVASSPLVRERAPALAVAAGLVAGPQHRLQGTLGGNVMLDTRCQWINQSYFWRSALGFCLKKDGTVCHVVEGGKRCVAAASNDTAPALMTLGAELELRTPREPDVVRTLSLDSLWKADGAWNKKLMPQDLVTGIRVPATTTGAANHRGAYWKLRRRGSIDFPLLGIAARLDLDEAGAVALADAVVVALQARPMHLKAAELLVGTTPGTDGFDAALAELCTKAHRQCTPLPNIPGDTDWRQEMVPVGVRRAFEAALAPAG